MATTRKLLVPFNPARPEWNSREFLIPSISQERIILIGLKQTKEYELGRVVFVGNVISEEDIFERFNGSSQEIENEVEVLTVLRHYVEILQHVRIGNVVRLKDNSIDQFDLEILSKTPSGFGKH